MLHTSETVGSASRPLKTPTANLGSNGGPRHPDERRAGGHGPTLDDEASFVLPYSIALREGREPEPEIDGPHSPASWWGEYLPGIRRWEGVTGRAAPSPTEIGLQGSPRVSARWVEWLMGLPRGYVTDVPGLTRGQQLQILGNGVVPQQASAAFAALLDLGV
ncbi:DNA (cytosine-5-)-methyltransferase [Streptomyces sp. PKU-EA00015]|nr:DNA (cytosine-5-)-methyltransferase [Streptomyces sp. PKU-EA00015]